VDDGEDLIKQSVRCRASFFPSGEMGGPGFPFKGDGRRGTINIGVFRNNIRLKNYIAGLNSLESDALSVKFDV
jgi:hypothetical protein